MGGSLESPNIAPIIPEPNPGSAVPWVIKQQWDSDDDTDIEYIALRILETYGLNCHRQTMAELIAYWRFEGDFADATGNGHDGTSFDTAAIVDEGQVPNSRRSFSWQPGA
ncbi:unnamed protein product [marine sediment metagenome]|uniref:Uncharacterized protein n=1 Tax=marine sediment metagenome TaxID=412755 RepID=X0YNE2_9ZZZZ